MVANTKSTTWFVEHDAIPCTCSILNEDVITKISCNNSFCGYNLVFERRVAAGVFGILDIMNGNSTNNGIDSFAHDCITIRSKGVVIIANNYP